MFHFLLVRWSQANVPELKMKYFSKSFFNLERWFFPFQLVLFKHPLIFTYVDLSLSSISSFVHRFSFLKHLLSSRFTLKILKYVLKRSISDQFLPFEFCRLNFFLLNCFWRKTVYLKLKKYVALCHLPIYCTTEKKWTSFSTNGFSKLKTCFMYYFFTLVCWSCFKR